MDTRSARSAKLVSYLERELGGATPGTTPRLPLHRRRRPGAAPPCASTTARTTRAPSARAGRAQRHVPVRRRHERRPPLPDPDVRVTPPGRRGLRGRSSWSRRRRAPRARRGPRRAQAAAACAERVDGRRAAARAFGCGRPCDGARRRGAARATARGGRPRSSRPSPPRRRGDDAVLAAARARGARSARTRPTRPTLSRSRSRRRRACPLDGRGGGGPAAPRRGGGADRDGRRSRTGWARPPGDGRRGAVRSKRPCLVPGQKPARCAASATKVAALRLSEDAARCSQNLSWLISHPQQHR